jgi:magnesium transporter
LVAVALTVGLALTAIVTFGSLTGSMLPFVLKGWALTPPRPRHHSWPRSVDVTGLVIYFSVAYLVLRGTLL